MELQFYAPLFFPQLKSQNFLKFISSSIFRLQQVSIIHDVDFAHYTRTSEVMICMEGSSVLYSQHESSFIEGNAVLRDDWVTYASRIMGVIN